MVLLVVALHVASRCRVSVHGEFLRFSAFISSLRSCLTRGRSFPPSPTFPDRTVVAYTTKRVHHIFWLSLRL